jgi:apolipoprotein N-acyltransferase
VLARWRLARAVGPGALLLTGATDLVIERNQLVGARNVITAIDGHGAIRGSYAKAHIVPYGEYLPMRALLEPLGIARLVPGDVDLIEGPGPRTLDFGPLGRIGLQICYEIIFSGEVIDRDDRPQAIFNPTNDGWFGAWGPPQHLAQARLRAIEEGLPVLRATMSGISAVVDANGVVRGSIPRAKSARIDGFVPRAHPATPFARLGNALALGWGAIFLVTALVANRRRRV